MLYKNKYSDTRYNLIAIMFYSVSHMPTNQQLLFLQTFLLPFFPSTSIRTTEHVAFLRLRVTALSLLNE